MEFDKTRNIDQNYTQNSTGVVEWGSDIWNWSQIIKIDIAERTRNCESLLLIITYLNIFITNHKK